MSSAAARFRPQDARISTAARCVPAWRFAAAPPCACSRRPAGSGAAAGRRRPTTSTSRSAAAEGLAGALERQAEAAPLVLAARVMANVRVAERAQALAGGDRVVAVLVRAVDDDLRRQVGHP